MRRMNEFFNIDELDLLTEEEKEYNRKHVKKLSMYADGKVDGVEIRNLTAGAATIAKRQQSRSALAVLKVNMALKGDLLPLENKTSENKDSA